MRKLIKSGLARTLASVLIALFAGPALFGWGLALPAFAQITTGANLELVAIVPFQDYSKAKAEGLGEKTASAVSQALLDTQQYEVRPLEETQQKMTDLGLRSPLDERNFDRLGAAMEVGGIVFGEIRSLEMRQISRSIQAEIVLMVGIYDVPTRSLRAGTIITARSSPAEKGASNDTLINEAISQAAFQVVNYITSYRPLVGDVQWSQSKVVTINIGEPQGVVNSMEFVVLRSGQRVGVIEITDVQRAFSDGKLKEGEARTGDKVRQIFRVEARGANNELPGVARGKKEGYSKIIWAVLAALALAGLSGSKGGNVAPSGIIASAIQNVINTSITKAPALLDPDTLDTLAEPTAVQVRWKASGASRELIQGYEIYRDGQLVFVVSAQGGFGASNQYTSPNEPFEFTITLDIDPNTGLALNPTISTADPPAAQAVTIEPADTTITYTIAVDWTTVDSVLTYVGPKQGTHHTWQVKQIFSEPVRDTDGNTTFRLSRSAPLSAISSATYISPPRLEIPADGDLVPDPTAVTFAFHAAPGADDFILQVSFDSQFLPATTRSRVLTNLAGTHSPSQLLQFTENLTDLLGSLGSGTHILWRIGNRWRGDTTDPLPYPMIGKAPADNYRYVFSESRALTIQ